MSKDDLVDVVLLMRPPAKWWPLGVVGYPGDHNGVRASERGITPDSSLVTKEFDSFTGLLTEKAIPHVIMDFPPELEAKRHPPKGAYDAVFLRDCAVIDPSGTSYVPVRFRDIRRQIEAPFVWRVLDDLGLQRLCDAKDVPGSIEGGDTITGFLPTGEKYLFTGLQRNDERGNIFLRELLGVPERNHVAIGTELCHIDSVMCAASRSSAQGNTLQSLIVCPELIGSSLKELTRLLLESGLNQPIVAERVDTSAENGTLAINGITVTSPSGDYLISGAQFRDQSQIVHELRCAGFAHIFSSLAQYLLFSSGGVRCSTQVIRIPGANHLRFSKPS